MEQVQEKEKEKLEFLISKTSLSSRLFGVYQSLNEQGDPGDLLTTLMTGTNSYFWAQKEAYATADKTTRGRSNYNTQVMRLMDYRLDDSVDDQMEQSTLDLLTSAINNFLADKQELPQDPKRRENMLWIVKALMIQLISQGLVKMLRELKIPEYIKPTVDRCYEELNAKADQIWMEFLNDVKELGNDHLIDYLSTFGQEFLANNTSTKALDKYNMILSQHLKSIKRPQEMYDRYLTRRKQYDAVAQNITKQNLYDIFDITKGSFRNAQTALYSEFELRYNDDINSQYLMKLIHGIK